MFGISSLLSSIISIIFTVEYLTGSLYLNASFGVLIHPTYLDSDVYYNKPLYFFFSLMFFIGYIINFGYIKKESLPQFTRYFGFGSAILMGFSLTGLIFTANNTIELISIPPASITSFNRRTEFGSGVQAAIFIIILILIESIILEKMDISDKKTNFIEVKKVLFICEMCGSKIIDEKGTFCSKCGAPIGS